MLFRSGPRVVTIEKITKGSTEQPVEVHLVEYPGRPYKPSKTQRRVLMSAWGKDTAVYEGRQMKLVGDPSVKFAGTAVGGIKIGALSHIEKTLRLSLTETKGKRAVQVVEPLETTTPTPPATQPDDETARAIADLRARYEASTDEVERASIMAERDRLLAGGA